MPHKAAQAAHGARRPAAGVGGAARLEIGHTASQAGEASRGSPPRTVGLEFGNMGHMKAALSWLLAILYIVAPWTSAVAADASACYSIQDADARAYCLAKAHRDPARCYSIQNPGLRSQCMAEIPR